MFFSNFQKVPLSNFTYSNVIGDLVYCIVNVKVYARLLKCDNLAKLFSLQSRLLACRIYSYGIVLGTFSPKLNL